MPSNNEEISQRWLAALVSPNFIVGPNTTSITSTYSSAITLRATSGTPNVLGNPYDASPLPGRNALLQSLSAPMTTIAGGATSVTWFVSLESNGDDAITPEIDTPIVLRPGSTVIGSAVASFRDGGLPFMRPRDGAAGTGTLLGTTGILYMWIKCTQAGGSFDVINPRLFWTGTTPPGMGTNLPAP